MSSPAPGTVLRQNPRVACRVYDGMAEVITLDEPIRQHRLNEVGTRIWELVEHGLTLEDVARALVREFDIDEPTARADAATFVEDLLARGILVADA